MRMNADDMLRYCNDPPAMGYCYSNDAPDWCECLPLVLTKCGMARCLGCARVCMCSCWVKKRGATFTADDGWTTVMYKEELNVGLADVSLSRLTRISAFSHARMHARTHTCLDIWSGWCIIAMPMGLEEVWLWPGCTDGRQGRADAGADPRTAEAPPSRTGNTTQSNGHGRHGTTGTARQA